MSTRHAASATRQSRRGLPRGFLSAEGFFFLLMMVVLAGLMFSAYRRIQENKDSKPSRNASQHTEKYLQYLAHAPDETHEVIARPDAAGFSIGAAGASAGGGAVTAPPGPEEVLAALEHYTPAARSTASIPSEPPIAPLPESVGSQPMGIEEAALEPASHTLMSVNAGASHSASAGAPDDVALVNMAGDQESESAETVSFADLRGTGSHLPGGVLLVGEGQLTAVPTTDGSAEESDPSGTGGPGGTTLMIGVGASRGAFSSSTEDGTGAASSRRAKPRASKLHLRGLTYVGRDRDVWTRWPDANRRNITGKVGVDRLNQAFEILANSQAKPIADDLFRKGIAISFGDPADFTGEHATNAATLIFSTTVGPLKGRPTEPPQINLHPRFAKEDPRVLAAVLAHEGTHLQQFLDGTLFQTGSDPLDVEMAAWVNAASVWQQLRGSTSSLDSQLAREAELGYQVARWGEGAMRDFLKALYP